MSIVCGWDLSKLEMAFSIYRHLSTRLYARVPVRPVESVSGCLRMFRRYLLSTGRAFDTAAIAARNHNDTVYYNYAETTA